MSVTLQPTVEEPEESFAEEATPHTVPEALQHLVLISGNQSVEDILACSTNAELIFAFAKAMNEILERIRALENK